MITDFNNENPTFAASAGGNLPTLGKFIDMDFHQPEAAALFAALALANTNNPPPDQGKPQAAKQLQIQLDNKSVINDANWTLDLQTSVYNFPKADYDILQAINYKITQAQIHPNIQWVKGHQDDYIAPEDLMDEAVANYYANKICDLMHRHPNNQVHWFPE
jgi:hypothetical protein